MLIAIVAGQRTHAQPKLRGHCPFCKGETIAKCGQHVVWHWAHKSANCDPWHESEGEWHRKWKALFPDDWQEVIAFAPSGEKHIADIKSPDGRVIEFQSSSIKPEEVVAREAFYAPMMWIVNGRRNEFDAFHFGISRQGRVEGTATSVHITWYGRSKLFARWAASIHPVYLDFGGAELWRIDKFDPHTKKGVVTIVIKDALIAEFVDMRPKQGHLF